MLSFPAKVRESVQERCWSFNMICPPPPPEKTIFFYHFVLSSSPTVATVVACRQRLTTEHKHM